MRKEEGPWLGLEREAALLSPSTPRNTCLHGVAVPQSHVSHPPQHQTKGEAPSPKGYSPPQPGLYIQWFSAVLWLRGPWGGGGGPPILESQLDSGSDLGLWSIPGPTVCAICFSLKDGTQPYKSHRPIRNIPLKLETKNWLFSCRPDSCVCFPVSYVAPLGSCAGT